jgi:dephospho-CoA kinase
VGRPDESPPPHRLLRVGLTGGIASGKSRVAGCLAARGLCVLELDRVAHQLMSPGGSAYQEVIEEFGPAIVGSGGLIDRAALGEQVFEDAGARSRLNAIVHPKVRTEEARLVREAEERGARVVVTEAALLVESGRHLRFARLAVAHCSPEEQLRRILLRDGLAERDAERRMAAQLAAAEKLGFAHFVVDTSGTLHDTDLAADRLADEIESLAAKPVEPRAPSLAVAVGALRFGPPVGPRGLTPLQLAVDLGLDGELNLERLAQRLQPPSPGPWYQAANAPHAGPGPVGLVAPLVIWALGRRGGDEPHLLAAAHSLGRLFSRDPGDVGRACVLSLVLQALMLGAPPRSLAKRLPGWRRDAERWAGAAFGDDLHHAIASTVRHPDDASSASRLCASLGGSPETAGVLVGGLTGCDPALAPPALVEAARGLISVCGA